jgi:hypothetical protein
VIQDCDAVQSVFHINCENVALKSGHCVGRSRTAREGIGRACKERRENCKSVALMTIREEVRFC